ncbi:MAG: helix-turn-helix domain-containing protein [Chloroflexota bacterium]|nr:helix-turn-helix domain-containing protein [Chloroflexota bacterium]
MDRTILQRCRGFTPVIDVVADDVGFVTAAVYGVHWRYCQMDHGVSSASMESIAARLGISQKTARRHTKKLCQEQHGYLQDLTPNRRHAPHVYRDTGKVKIEALVEARLDRESHLEASRSDLESNQVGQKVPPGGTESPSRWDRESNKDSIKIQEEETREDTLSSLWTAIQTTLQGLMATSTFDTHFASAQPVTLYGQTLVVALPNQRSLEAIQRLNGHIDAAVKAQHKLNLTFIAEEP